MAIIPHTYDAVQLDPASAPDVVSKRLVLLIGAVHLVRCRDTIDIYGYGSNTDEPYSRHLFGQRALYIRVDMCRHQSMLERASRSI